MFMNVHNHSGAPVYDSHFLGANVGKYSIHRAYGIAKLVQITATTMVYDTHNCS